MPQHVEETEVVAWRPFMLAVAGVVVASIVFVGWLATGLGGPWVAFTLMDNLAEILAPLAAALACARVARRRRGRLGWSWFLLGASAASWALGQTVWTCEVAPILRRVGYLVPAVVAASRLR